MLSVCRTWVGMKRKAVDVKEVADGYSELLFKIAASDDVKGNWRQDPEGFGLQSDSCTALAQNLTCEVGVIHTESD